MKIDKYKDTIILNKEQQEMINSEVGRITKMNKAKKEAREKKNEWTN